MKMKKLISMAAALAMACTVMADPVFSGGVTSYAADSTDKVASYSYEITPILAPFNEYFFVKTDNPDPTSFRFIDKTSVYDDINPTEIGMDNDRYEDIKYENSITGRVDGGYIFYCYGGTDGGEVVLQARDERYYSWDENAWTDTTVKYQLPALKDNVDYLIDTYAKGSSFFEKMNTVQSGLNSICLYSGSYIRGSVLREKDHWALSNSPYADQHLYIQSPYSRLSDKYLFASYVYPYKLTSLGFPSMMMSVAKRIDSRADCKWDEYYHAHINVTLNGETRSYGGQGSGKGQGISADKISRYFSFGSGSKPVVLTEIKTLLDNYSKIKMDDDIPHIDDLTWSQVTENAGSGEWASIIGLASVYGGPYNCFTYLYKRDNDDSFSTSDAGVGGSLIWGGSLGFCQNMWVDGRYINEYEVFVPGEKFEDHPTSAILLKVPDAPQITYDSSWKPNYQTGYYEIEYSNVKVSEKETSLVYSYDEYSDCWYTYFVNEETSAVIPVEELVEQGLLDKKYLDMLELTREEVEALDVDRNTYDVPTQGRIYDRTAAAGTPFNYEVGDINLDGDINMKDMAMLQNYLNDKDSMFIGRNIADTNHDNEVNLKDYAVLQQYLNGWNVKLQ